MTTASPSVATARLTPRARKAGSEIRIPTGIVNTTPTASATGNGKPNTAAMRLENSAPIPANAYCASDI